MQKQLRILAGALAVSTALVACTVKDAGDKGDSSRAMAAAPKTPPDRASEEAAIRQMDEQYFAAVNAKDADAIAAVYAEDAVSLPGNAPMLKGRAAIRDFNAGFVKLPKLSLTGQSVSINFSDDGTVAYETGTYAMSFADAKGRTIKDEGKFLNVLKKIDGKWLIVVDAFNSSMPMQ